MINVKGYDMQGKYSYFCMVLAQTLPLSFISSLFYNYIQMFWSKQQNFTSKSNSFTIDLQFEKYIVIEMLPV